MAVHRQVARLDSPSGTERTTDVARPDRTRKSERGVVGDGDGVGLILEGDHHNDRTKDLLGHHGGRRVHRSQHGGREPEARTRRARAPKSDRGPVGNERGDNLELGARHQRSHLGRLERRIADHNPSDGWLEQFHKSVIRAALHQDPRSCTAVLPGIVEDPVRGPGGCHLEVGVGEDHIGTLATELEGHPLDLLSTARHDLRAHLRRAGEAHLGHLLMSHKAPTHHRALAGEHREDPFGDPSLEGQLPKAHRRQRGDLGWLEDHGVSSG